MKAFLEKIEKDYLDDFVYVSKYPLLNRGIETVDFDGTNLKTLDEHNPQRGDIIIGSVEATEHFFKLCNIQIPSYLGYPDVLKKYLGRRIVKTNFAKALDEEFPYFIKPSDKIKLFTGTLVENQRQYNILKDFYHGIFPETSLYLSEPIDFISEYRCFVHKNELRGIQYYTGNFKIFPDVEIIEKMINDYQYECPIAYTLDIGVVKRPFSCPGGWKYETLLVEVNDMWAIGSYGFDSKAYVQMTIDRFNQIIKTN